MVVAQGLFCACRQDVSHLKACLGLEDLMLMWFTHVAIDRRPPLLAGSRQEISVSHYMDLSIDLLDCPITSPKLSN